MKGSLITAYFLEKLTTFPAGDVFERTSKHVVRNLVDKIIRPVFL